MTDKPWMFLVENSTTITEDQAKAQFDRFNPTLPMEERVAKFRKTVEEFKAWYSRRRRA